MSGVWVGLPSGMAFLEVFMPKTVDAPPRVGFPAVLDGARNACRPFVRAVEKTGVSANVSLRVVCHPRAYRPGEDEDDGNATALSGQAGPGLSAPEGFDDSRADDSSALLDWHTDSLLVDFNDSPSADPFYTLAEARALPPSDKRVDKDDPASLAALHKLSHLAREVFLRQHRLHLFLVVVAGPFARLVRWDRAGAIVSDRFDYVQEHPEWLAEFIWRYNHMSATERGVDTTAYLASAEERSVFQEQVKSFVCDMQDPHSDQRPIPGAEHTLDASFPTYKISVKKGKVGQDQVLVVQRPFNNVVSYPCGRVTRAYLAYSLAEKTLVFYKDTWRPQFDALESEDVTFGVLLGAGVPALPEVLCAGDVQGETEVQATRSQDWLEKNEAQAIVNAAAVVRKYTHFRLVQELAYALETAKNTREIVEACRGSLRAMDVALNKTGLMHGDISINNIMIDGKGKPVLIDWDLAHKPIGPNAQAPFRTGTWGFRSIGLLKHPLTSNTPLDDLESLFWVLVFAALKIFAWKPSLGISLKPNFFYYRAEETVEGKVYAVGGLWKECRLSQRRFHEMPLKCAPLRELVTRMAEEWCRYHRALQAVGGESQKVRQGEKEKLEEMRERLGKPAFWIDMFDEALKRDEWEEDDIVPDRYPERVGEAPLPIRVVRFDGLADEDVTLKRRQFDEEIPQAKRARM